MATVSQFVDKLNRKIARIERQNVPLALAVKTVMALQAQRIFTQGEASDGGILGGYSTKPIYVNPNYVSPEGQPSTPKKFGGLKGKTGRSRFASGKRKGQAHKSRYFPKGYREFRQVIGRESRFVNLRLFGNLQSDFSNAPLGRPPVPTKVSQHEYVFRLTRDENVKKRLGLEGRYGKIFNLTAFEKKEFFRVFSDEVTKALR